MILCDKCNACYHEDCAKKTRGSRVHDGPWFCARCRNEIALYGPKDITQDFGLIDYLWTGHLPENPDEGDRIRQLSEVYRAGTGMYKDCIQVEIKGHLGMNWVEVPPLVSRKQLVMDMHHQHSHCGRDKLISLLREYYWWPGMQLDLRECLRKCSTCQKDKPKPATPEVLRHTDKGLEPLQGWSIDLAGPFTADEEDNTYIVVAVDPFSKWVEVQPLKSKHSWRLAEFLYSNIIARWGSPGGSGQIMVLSSKAALLGYVGPWGSSSYT